MDEYKTAKKNIKTGKAAGPAGIPPEVLKYCDLICKQASYDPWQAKPVVRKQSGSHTKRR